MFPCLNYKNHKPPTNSSVLKFPSIFPTAREGGTPLGMEKRPTSSLRDTSTRSFFGGDELTQCNSANSGNKTFHIDSNAYFVAAL